MPIQAIAETYRGKTDDELLLLADHPEQLTAEALAALTTELSSRRLSVSNAHNTPDNSPERYTNQAGRLDKPSTQLDVGPFIADVLRFYHANAWTFFKLSAPATLVTYLTITAAQNEARSIIRNVFPHTAAALSRPTLFLELGLVNLVKFLVVWLTTCLLFAATCSAVDHINSGLAPRFSDCFTETAHQLGRFIQLSALLLLLLVSFMAIALSLGLGLLSFAKLLHIHFQGFLLSWIGYGLAAAVMTVPARLNLAIPAVLLDDYPVGRSISLSHELTKGKLLILTALILKSLIGGYVGGMLPFWIRIWLWNLVPIPNWVAVVASLALVAAVEPPMFIGFALLYLRLGEKPTPVEAVPRTQFATG